VILFQLSFRRKERIGYLKQKMASGKGFHVVSKLLSTMLHHIIGLAPPTLYTVSSCTLGLRKFWRIVIKLPVGLFFSPKEPFQEEMLLQGNIKQNQG